MKVIIIEIDSVKKNGGKNNKKKENACSDRGTNITKKDKHQQKNNIPYVLCIFLVNCLPFVGTPHLIHSC